MSRPAWQTEELDEEWIEDDDNDSLNVTRRSGASATSTISLTEVIGSLDITDHHRRSHGSQASDRSADGGRSATAPRGTFVVREGVEAVPLMAKTPGKPKGAFAGMFTPLALEKMFEPPSPPPAGPSVLREPSPARSSPPQSAVPRHSPGPSPLSQSHLPVPPIPIVHITPSASFQFDASTHSAYPPQLEDGDTKTSQVPSTEFTFTAPRFTPIPFNPNPGRVALAESTPGPSCPQPGTKQRLDIETPLPLPSLPAPPMTDPRLRLFQFQYDTFTREHLSAILDTMPVHAGSPSTTNFSPHSAPASAVGNSVFSPIGELSLESATSIDRMRAAKRVKLSLRGESDESSTEESEASPPISARSHRTSESYGEGAGAGAHVARPKSAVQANLLQVHGQGSEEGTSRRDYVKESAAFMQQLKAHRDFSTVSTTSAMADMLDGSRIVSKGRSASNPSPSSSPVAVGPLPNPAATMHATNIDSNPFDSKKPASSLAYRQQAADLMAQIRMGSRRMFSTGTANFDQSPDVSFREPEGAANTPSSQDTVHAPQSVLDVPASARTSSVGTSSAGRTSSTIPGFVFTSRKTSTQPRQASNSSTAVPSGDERRADQPRKRSRLSTDPEDFDVEATPRASMLELPPPPPELLRVPSRIPSTSTNRSPSPTLSSFPMPPSSNPFNPTQAPAPSFAFPSAAPVYPTDTFRDRAGQDLNRYVSSSTTASGTTAATSVGSFVKHPGPPAKGPRAITQIRPEDLGALPRQIGSMVFDSREKIWHHRRRDTQELVDIADQSSDDPFRDIESLRDGEVSTARNSRSRLGGPAQEMVYPVEADDTREITGMGLAPSRSLLRDEHSRLDIDPNSFSIDEADVVPVMTGIEHSRRADVDDSDGTTDSEDGQDFLEMTASFTREHGDPEPSSELEPVNWRGGVAGSSFTVEALPPLPPLPSIPVIPPTPMRPQEQMSMIPPTPVLRPAMKSASVTPMSALRTAERYATPAPRALSPSHRRSVSFSDGKREGQIRGLGRELSLSSGGDESDGESEDRSLSALQTGDRSTFVPSARSRRIADMLAADDESAFLDSPSKSGSGSGSARSSLHEAQLSDQVSGSIQGSGSLRSRSRNASQRSLSRSNASLFMPDPTTASRKGDATFLTEWSFEIAHDRLITVITDVQPFKPYWEELDAIALDDKHLDSVARLKEFLPRLDALSMNSNQLTYLTGVPASVRTLSVSHNRLTSVTSFQHILNLENLDISRNEVDSLQHLSCLRHLRELRADGNQIASTDGLQTLDSLVKLSLQGNRIRAVDFAAHRWPRLEMLNMSDNRIEVVENIEALSALVALNLDSNAITALDSSNAMAKLRVLRVSNNKLQRLSGAAFPNLRTLYADNNAIVGLDKASRLSKLENLSLRNQSGKGLKLRIRDIRDVKRLYLSGNPLDDAFIQDACYNLIYLEVAACRLTVLPPNFGTLVPNLRALNLNYNFLTDLYPLNGLGRLKKLTLIGSRMTTSKALIKCIRGMPDVEMIDFRMNPCTLGWYLPLLVRDAPGALQPSEGKREHAADERGTAWRDLDAKFRKDLPDEAYVGRLVYRGLIMQACAGMKLLDGVPITSKERDKAGRLLESILANRTSASAAKAGRA